MRDLYAKKYGYRYFTVVHQNSCYRAYKLGYYWSNMAEGYILVIYRWLPKRKRAPLPHPLSDRKPPYIRIAMKSGKNGLSDIRKIQRLLIKSGYANLQDIFD